LSFCYRIDADELKCFLRKYYKNKGLVDYFNLNFCLNLARKSNNSLKRQIDLSKFSNLNELHAINFAFDLEDLSALTSNSPHLKSLSFALASEKVVDNNSKLKTKPSTSKLNLDGFKTIDSIRVEFKSRAVGLFLDLLGNYFTNVTSLEFYSIPDESKFRLKFNNENFPLGGYTRLEELVLGTSNLSFDLADNLLISTACRLKRFHLNVTIDQKSSAKLSSLVGTAIRIEKIGLNLDVDLAFIRNSNLVLDKNPYDLDEIVREHMMLLEAHFSKLDQILVSMVVWPSVINNLSTLALSSCENLSKLEISSIHVHSDESICKIISSLKCWLIFISSSSSICYHF
jgi:hypothetical protein